MLLHEVIKTFQWYVQISPSLVCLRTLSSQYCQKVLHMHQLSSHLSWPTWSCLGNCAQWIFSEHRTEYPVKCVNVATSLTHPWVQSCPKCKSFWLVWRNRYLTRPTVHPQTLFYMTCSKKVQCLKPSSNYVTKYSLKANLWRNRLECNTTMFEFKSPGDPIFVNVLLGS